MSYDFDKGMGRRIRKYRKRNKWTQNVLAAKMQLEGCDISRSTLAAIEAGMRHLYSWEIYQFKQILHISYEQLFEDEPQKATDE